MGNEVEQVLSGEQYVDIQPDVVKLIKNFTHLYRTRIDPDTPARVKSLVVIMAKGAEPYRCKRRRYPPAQIKFLDDYIGQLLKFGFLRKTNLSKWASHTLPVCKSDDKSAFSVTNNYTEANKRAVSIARTMSHFSDFLCFLWGGYTPLYECLKERHIQPYTSRTKCTVFTKLYSTNELLSGLTICPGAAGLSTGKESAKIPSNYLDLARLRCFKPPSIYS
ncbi:hypothetical protein PHMEG_0003418 [Phytophthora megakarya]|uniref:Uncharacterized protein n=1 Tax=Phytophthora megakarya TaxID=4795 RepID=A0A225WWG7_9STRA|nr:hypothetical protein PHMEG_0003418 [Phytophthora megakarya]